MLSWNVNGIRSAYRKGLLAWLKQKKPDIICLQETRAWKAQVDAELAEPADYYSFWNSAVRAGYAGTAILSRRKPLSVTCGLGVEEFDTEGRVIIAAYHDFVLVNCYFPNGNRNESRLAYKLRFFDAFMKKCNELRAQGSKVIFCGDLNTAHREIDLANPEGNGRKSGFLPEERDWIDRMVKAGYIDTFRYFNPDLRNQFTWWSYTSRAWERNRGWRFDYVFAADEMMERIVDSFIVTDVRYSDHSPVGIRLASDVAPRTLTGHRRNETMRPRWGSGQSPRTNA